MNNTQKRTLRRIIIEAALLLLLLPLQARAAEYKCTAVSYTHLTLPTNREV